MKRFKKSLNFLFLILFLWAIGFGVYADRVLTMKVEAAEEVTDAIVTLTGGDKRIETGLGLLAEKKSKYLFISGVHPEVKDSEIRRLWTGKPALPACCLVLGQKATTTIQNARETKDWVEKNEIKSIRLVTSDYHMPRALLELSQAMPDIKIIITPVKQFDVKSPQLWTLIFKEYHKTIVRAVMFALHVDSYIS